MSDRLKDRKKTDRGPRVGYLLRMYPRFTQTFIVNEILELERQGLDVRIVSLRKPNEGIFHESIARVKARAHYIPETHHGQLRKILGSHWPVVRRSPRLYARALGLARRGGHDATWYDLARAIFVLRWAKKNRVDRLHVHFGTSEATVAMLAKLIGGLPYSMTLHAFDIFRDNVDRPMLARKINNSRFTVTVSDFNRRFMIDHLIGVDPEKIRVNYNGIDLDLFGYTDARDRAFSILSVGRLKEKKGFSHLIRAIELLRDDGFAVSCKIVGEGPDDKPLKAQIKRAGLSSLVELTGPLAQHRVRELTAQASLFVLPCIRAKDGNMDALPTVLLESLASGCPTISTRLGGVPEIIEHRVSGLVVEPGDDHELARSIRTVLEDKTLAAALSTGGRSRAERRFCIRTNVAVMRQWLCNGSAEWRPGKPGVRPAVVDAPVGSSSTGHGDAHVLTKAS